MLNEPFVDFFSVLLNARSEISTEFQLLGHNAGWSIQNIDLFWNMTLNISIKG